jgi:phosphoribosyl-AMP cyclohydrolase / phosphoribosyl-ATP pyrophosphohydrolase
MRDRSAPLTEADVDSLAWEKMNGLLPAVVQDQRTGGVLMLGYMDRAALAGTLHSGLATFYSRSKQRLWQKGETSGNRLKVRGVFADCDDDALLVLADPEGPTCHLGTTSCFVAEMENSGWLSELSSIIAERAASGDASSYTRQLLDDGSERIGKKIGEEGVEVALAAVSRDVEGCVEEVADLIYHVSVLMEARGFSWNDVTALLKERHAKASNERTASS